MDPNLFKAAMEGKIDANNYLDDLDFQLTPNRNTALHIAALFGNTVCVKTILDNFPSLLCQTNINGETALHMASKEGYDDVVGVLIDYAARQNEIVVVRMTNENCDTALHEAVRFEHLNVVKLLVQVDAEFSYQPNKDGETPLFLAVEKGLSDEFVTQILHTSKSSSASGPNDTTALHAAILLDDKGSVAKLLEWNEILSLKGDVNGWTPLHYAVQLDNLERAKQLLTFDDKIRSASSSMPIAYLTTSENDGKNTALHLAVIRGNVHMIELLLSHRPDCFEIVNGKGQNIIHIALENKQDKVIKFLKMNTKYKPYLDVLVNHKDNDGNTPLHVLASLRRLLPEFILHPKLQKMIFNKRNMTPMDTCTRGIRNLMQTTLPPAFNSSASYDDGKDIQRFYYDPDKKNYLGPNGKRNFLKRRMEKEEKDEKVKVEELKRLIKVRDPNLIVASLIATVTFAAGFTLPGGYNEGQAVLVTNRAFQTFVVADIIACMFSSTAVFLFFYATTIKDDEGSYRGLRSMYRSSNMLTFYRSANMLIFYAQGAMLIAFITGLYSVLPNLSGLAITTCLLGSVFLVIYYLLLLRLNFRSPTFG